MIVDINNIEDIIIAKYLIDSEGEEYTRSDLNKFMDTFCKLDYSYIYVNYKNGDTKIIPFSIYKSESHFFLIISGSREQEDNKFIIDLVKGIDFSKLKIKNDNEIGDQYKVIAHNNRYYEI